MADFNDIAGSLSCHFCPQCGCSFECDNEDGYCNCPGSNCGDPAWCDDCAEAYEAEQEQERADEDETED